jgi:hypothetical protein
VNSISVVYDSSGTGCCEQGKKLSGSIKGAEIIDQLKDYYLLRKEWSSTNLGTL